MWYIKHGRVQKCSTYWIFSWLGHSQVWQGLVSLRGIPHLKHKIIHQQINPFIHFHFSLYLKSVGNPCLLSSPYLHWYVIKVLMTELLLLNMKVLCLLLIIFYYICAFYMCAYLSLLQFVLLNNNCILVTDFICNTCIKKAW